MIFAKTNTGGEKRMGRVGVGRGMDKLSTPYSGQKFFRDIDFCHTNFLKQ